MLKNNFRGNCVSLRAVFSISLFLAVLIIRRVFMLDLFVFPELIHSLLDFERRRVIHGCP